MVPTNSDICVVLSTIDADHAEAFAQQACARRLVACVNRLPGVHATYWWRGKVCHDREELLMMEVPADDVEARLLALAELHPYDVPKLLALPVAAALPAFVTWCKQACQSEPSD